MFCDVWVHFTGRSGESQTCHGSKTARLYYLYFLERPKIFTILVAWPLSYLTNGLQMLKPNC